jgi:hypothetical protein
MMAALEGDAIRPIYFARLPDLFNRIDPKLTQAAGQPISAPDSIAVDTFAYTRFNFGDK